MFLHIVDLYFKSVRLAQWYSTCLSCLRSRVQFQVTIVFFNILYKVVPSTGVVVLLPAGHPHPAVEIPGTVEGKRR